ncbi:MAG: hypothetical protein HY013_12530, partial [Candidatus Solibacter usitatus]|nr:hypothetical protein [Candidatus Solibacter usitatus]
MRRCAAAWVLLAPCSALAWQQAEPPKPAESSKRIELNLLGATDTAAGESRRNENIQFNLVDNNPLKELNVRLGTTATIHEFRAERGYFGAEFGNAPTAVLHLPALAKKSAGLHGSLYLSHLNSVFSARSFFQAGDVKPARENDYGFAAGASPWRGARLQVDGSQQKLRGSVNGNVLVPKADERTPLAADPATRALVARFLAAYPADLPNRTERNPRALNRNASQVINNNHGGVRLDQSLGSKDHLALQYTFTSQSVRAFQLVAGQNPDTDTKSHQVRITWTRQWNAGTVTDFSTGFDRLGSLLRPEPHAVGPMVSISGLETLGPQSIIPIDRAQNLYRQAGGLRRSSGSHQWTAGFHLLRRQLNGKETDAHRGFFSFSNDFGRDAITNFRLGTPSQHIISIGDIHRGFRNWDMQYYADDTWRAATRLTLQYGLRYQPVTRPDEVNGRNTIPYDCDCNNLAPQFGAAFRLPRRWGSLRSAYGLQFGEIFPVTFQQVRFSPPGSVKIVVPAPDLVNPLGGRLADPRGNLYLLDPQLATPYSHQYNFSWEPDLSRTWKLQIGYVGSRSHKLLIMWYLNRAHLVPGIPQTTATLNQRRPDQRYADVRWVLNGSRGYFDAARIALVVPRWHGLSVDAAYWFSKAMDLGSSYTNTAYDADSRLARSQSEFETHRDMRARSGFDQPQAFLWRAAYAAPKPLGGWMLSGVLLLKSGSPFTVMAGSDAPGFGNVDGNGGDRPNLLNPSILGRTIGHPDTSVGLLPPAAFAYITSTQDAGALGRNTFRRGGIHNLNASLSRGWTVSGEKRISLRAESINLLNAPQF